MNLDYNALISQFTAVASTYVPKVLLALIVLWVGLKIIKGFMGVLSKSMSKKGLDESLSSFLCSLFGMILKLMLFISVISMLGVATTSFVAVLGAAGLAVGMALQGTLGNFAGSVLIMIFRPFKVGDYIITQGEEGVVKSIDIFTTQLLGLDNRLAIIPNGKLAGDKLINVTAEETRRVDISVGISYDDDFKKAKEVLEQLAAEDSNILNQPAPFVGITDFGDSSVNLTFRAWCKTEDYWDVFFNLNQKTKELFDKSGISIPYPQIDVHQK